MIKKLVCALLAISLCITAIGFSVAENVDVSSLSDEDLLALRDLVLAEVALRHLDNTMAFWQWYDFGLGQYLPKPSEVFGRETKQNNTITNNDDRWFADNLDAVSHEEFEAYVAALRMYGFNDNISASGISFEADNVDGIHISISLIGKVLFVDAKKK